MAKMKIALVTKPGGDFEIQEREIPQPGTGHIRIRVQACGICFSDHYAKDGLWPGLARNRSAPADFSTGSASHGFFCLRRRCRANRLGGNFESILVHIEFLFPVQAFDKLARRLTHRSRKT